MLTIYLLGRTGRGEQEGEADQFFNGGPERKMETQRYAESLLSHFSSVDLKFQRRLLKIKMSKVSVFD